MPTPWLIDPAVGSDLASSSSLTNIYDPLVFPNPIGEILSAGAVKPRIATYWTSSSDGLTWTFTIRQGVKFHTGRNLTATDVAFSMNRLVTMGQGYSYIFSPYIASAIATDNYTVVFTLKRAFGPFLIALVRLYILDSAEVMSHNTTGSYGANGDYGAGWLLTHDAGSGPFMVKENLPEAHLDMTFFSDYWGQVAPLHPTEMLLIAEPTPTTERTMMLNKQAEISSPWLPEETLDALANSTGIYIANIPEPDEYYYMMNTKKPPLDDIHVRKALAYVMDYKTMVSQLYPRYTVSSSVVPASLPGYANTTIYYYNLTKAQEELKLSKYYPDILTNTSLAIDFDWISAVPIREQDALFFATQANKIGVKVNVISEEWAKFISDVGSLATTPGMANVLVAPHYPETGSLLESRYSSKSMKTWEQMEWLNDTTFDSMLEDALGTINQTERYAKYTTLQQYIINLCPSLFIYDYSQLTAVQSYVSWPMAQNTGNSNPVMGYNFDGRLIEIQSH
jgi:peptide/nickel transport system substrate-binding protein